MFKLSRAVLVFYLLLLCIQKVAAEDDLVRDSDPWERWNRKVYQFNHFADRYALKPLARGYKFITPQFVETGISKVFRNLHEPLTIINDLLQFKLSQAGMDSGRFVLNSTVGLAGFYDVASALGLERHQEDFGQSLGYWGVNSGPYLELPLLGGSSVRDAFGILPGNYVNPIYSASDEIVQASTTGLSAVDIRSNLLDVEDLMTGDRYIFLRESYLQNREALVRDGELVDDFGDDEF